ncbi:unnamed protein product, partial [Rotaria socialis]
MKKEEREALRLRGATFHNGTAGGNMKTTWNVLKKKVVVIQLYIESSKDMYNLKSQQICQ